jgi:hypothetical protein
MSNFMAKDCVVRFQFFIVLNKYQCNSLHVSRMFEAASNSYADQLGQANVGSPGVEGSR